MSLHVLALGTLVADPVRRTGATGHFATATIRVSTGDGESTLIGAIAFGDLAQRLFELGKGSSVSVAGRASLRSWTAKDGTERSGWSITVSEIAATKPRKRQRAKRPDAAGAVTGQAGPSRV